MVPYIEVFKLRRGENVLDAGGNRLVQPLAVLRTTEGIAYWPDPPIFLPKNADRFKREVLC